MMTTMARLPCKQTSPSQQRGGYSSGGGAVMSAPQNFAQSRGYWEMQQQQQQQTPPPPQQYARSHHRHHADHIGKRKSAVELLQESKAFYVKSETVLDRKQELKNSGHLQVSQVTAPGAPPRLLRKCSSGGGSVVVVSPPLQQQSQQQCCWATCPSTVDVPDRPLPPKSPRLVPVPRRSGPSPNNGLNSGIGPSESSQLQAKLRRLLNTDSKENVFFPDNEVVPAPPAEYATPLTNGVDDKYRYSPGGSLSPGCRDDERWGQPAGEVRFKFGRSNSHSHGARPSSSGGRSAGSGRSSSGHGGSAASSYEASTGGVCHKSLPDLHTSTRRRASLSPRASTKSSTNSRRMQQQQSPGCCPDCETGSDYSDKSFNRDSTCYRSSRHIRRSMGSGGGDASSVLSSGGRTQKSSGSSKLSHGANARDSGGSSGHCTHRSEPPPRIQDCWSHVRRDSGASTQHSTERGDRSRKGSAYNSNNNNNNNGTPPPAIVRHYSPESESSNSQTEYSPTCNSRFSDGWKEGRGRPILRSKSDISDRYWRHDSRKSSRPPRSMTQLESFFDRLGLEPEDYHANITEPSSKTSSPIFFDSVSSVDSALGLYPSWAAANSSQNWAANNEDCPTNQRSGDPPSIVERNARIIKWLCQCRKAQFGYS